jgi:hypothetical protein
MKKFKQLAGGLTEQVRFRLQKGCNNLSPQKRMITILCLCSAFGIVSFYMTASSFYTIWRNDKQTNKIHQVIKESGSRHLEVTTDSIIKPSKHLEYE